MGKMRSVGLLLLLLLLLLASALLSAAYARTTFLSEDIGGEMRNGRMLRGRSRRRGSRSSRIPLNDYDIPSANHGHDPGRGFGGNGRWRRENP